MTNAQVDTCLSKTPYRTKGEARAAAQRVSITSGVLLYAYRCEHCYNWHITSSVPSEVREDVRAYKP